MYISTYQSKQISNPQRMCSSKYLNFTLWWNSTNPLSSSYLPTFFAIYWKVPGKLASQS